MWLPLFFVWKRWFYLSLQVRILQRAMSLLKHNGRIVYSTCSLNPVENEAVIAEALKLNPGMSRLAKSSMRTVLHYLPHSISACGCFVDVAWIETATWALKMATMCWQEFNENIRDLSGIPEFWPWHSSQNETDWGTFSSPRCRISKFALLVFANNTWWLLELLTSQACAYILTYRIQVASLSPFWRRQIRHLLKICSKGLFVFILKLGYWVLSRKRNAKNPSEATQSKRPRLEGVTVKDLVVTPTNSFEVDKPIHDITMGPQSGQDSAKIPASGEANNGEKAQVVKPSGTESFKENPYTFLSSTDPILVSCMCVLSSLSSGISWCLFAESDWNWVPTFLLRISSFVTLRESPHGHSISLTIWSRISSNIMITLASGLRSREQSYSQSRRVARESMPNSVFWARVYLSFYPI